MNWISVEDALPSEGDWILYCVGNKTIEMGMLLDGKFCSPDLNYMIREETTHWMLLPEPPK